MTQPVDPKYLAPTPTLDFDHPAVAAFGRAKTAEAATPLGRAVALYYAVRDGIWYDPYSPFYKPEHYRASWVLAAGRGYCVQKASLLAALARGVGIPSRLAFATVRNHLATRQLLDFLGSDLFVFHGVVELFLEGRWVKATPAFNAALCARHRVEPLEFDGRADSVFQPYNLENRKFMEYVAFHGTYDDVPLAELLAAWKRTYGASRVEGWVEALERGDALRPRRFETEEVVTT
ncbi:MAG: transglutaminase-like domain-containing protein [Deferrisomatales bacterium]|nr:transglutaminase-like domain-containing protein [Deferrisomatales bacterium]